MPKNDVSISISPTEPHYGDELNVTITGSEGRGVYSVACFDDDGNLIYSDSGNDNDHTSTLASLNWTGGGAHCTVEAKEQRKSGNPYTAATLEFEVLA